MMMAYSHPWETEPNGVTTMADVSQDGLPVEPTENTVETARARLFAKGRYIDHDNLPTPERVAAAREALNKPFRDYVDAFEAAVRADERSKATPAASSEAVVERVASRPKMRRSTRN